MVEQELVEVKRRCLEVVKGSRLITCTLDHIRVEIKKTKVQTLVALLHFQPGYPSEKPLLIELRSKTLGHNFLLGLTQLCEKELDKFEGESQVLRVLVFIRKFIDDHPLCSCSEEISQLKRDVITEADLINLKQKTSCISLTLKENLYVHKVHIFIPEDYPETRIRIETKHSSFSTATQRYLLAQSKEIARRCVQPPLSKKKNLGIFEPKPSLLPVVTFLSEQVHFLPKQKCPVCRQQCFPKDPVDVTNDENDDLHVERVYCGHLYHLSCLVNYMKSPPFNGQKKCNDCGKEIYHEKYKLSTELTESRWAYHQARQREVEEVVEFLK